MESGDIVQIVSILVTAIVSIVGLLVRARIISLEGEIKALNLVITAANVLILKQGNTIDAMSAHIMASQPPPRGIVKDDPYEAMSPYRKQK